MHGVFGVGQCNRTMPAFHHINGDLIRGRLIQCSGTIRRGFLVRLVPSLGCSISRGIHSSIRVSMFLIGYRYMTGFNNIPSLLRNCVIGLDFLFHHKYETLYALIAQRCCLYPGECALQANAAVFCTGYGAG